MSKFAEEESDREEDKSLPQGEEAGLEPGLATLYGLALSRGPQCYSDQWCLT